MTTAWEYKVIRIAGTPLDRNAGGMKKLNEAGAEGWEAVAIDVGYALCKRPVRSEPNDDG